MVVRSRAPHTRAIAASFGALGATVAAHTLFRLAYYGAATPNTFTLKIGGVGLVDRIDRGVTVVVDIVGIELLVPLVIVALGFLVDRRAPSRLEQLAGVADPRGRSRTSPTPAPTRGSG